MAEGRYGKILTLASDGNSDKKELGMAWCKGRGFEPWCSNRRVIVCLGGDRNPGGEDQELVRSNGCRRDGGNRSQMPDSEALPYFWRVIHQDCCSRSVNDEERQTVKHKAVWVAGLEGSVSGL